MKNKLLKLRNEILKSQKVENDNIQSVLKWLKKRNKVNKMKVSKISVNKLKDWYLKKNGSIWIIQIYNTNYSSKDITKKKIKKIKKKKNMINQ